MAPGFGHGVHDWSDEGIEEEEEDIAHRRRRADTSSGPAMPPPSPSPRPWLNWITGKKAPPYVRQSSGILWRRSLSPPPGLRASRAMGPTPVAYSVRTRRRSPISPGAPAAAGGGGGAAGGPPDEEFSFHPLVRPPDVPGAAQVLDYFVGPGTPNTTNATMGAAAAAARARTEHIKKELLLNRRVTDLEGLERWLRRAEALAGLAWFTDLCSREEEKEVPPLELFECALRALEDALSGELRRGAIARRSWIGSVAVPEFFCCPVTNTIMENPVVIASGKTVDQSALVKWWDKHKNICPVTREALTRSVFIPDVIIASFISQWRAANSIADVVIASSDAPAISPEEEALFREATLLDHSPSTSKEAVLRLRELVYDERCSYLHLIGQSPGTIAKLVAILPETCLNPDHELDDIVLDIIAKAASYGPNKEVFGDNRYAIPVLIARSFVGPLHTRSKCAHILGLLADNYYNKIKIGELGGIAAMMELLSIGDIDVKRAVATALASLCEAKENCSQFLREGVADAAIALLREDGLVDEAHGILARAEGFELAMVDVMEKLMSFGGDAMCKMMINRLRVTFIGSTPGERRLPSLAGNSGESSDNSGAGQTMKDVEGIIPWLQMRSCYPLTYRYRYML